MCMNLIAGCPCFRMLGALIIQICIHQGWWTPVARADNGQGACAQPGESPYTLGAKRVEPDCCAGYQVFLGFRSGRGVVRLMNINPKCERRRMAGYEKCAGAGTAASSGRYRVSQS